MDEADLAQQMIEREEALMRRARRLPALPYSGQCYWCGEDVAAPRRWCDAECRDHWERARARRA